MTDTSRLNLIGGVALAVGGVGFFLAGMLHPHGSPDQGFQEAITAMLRNPTWPFAHWIALVSAMLLVWALSLLLDSGALLGSVLARAGARLAIPAGLFMAVEFAVEIAARSAVEDFAAGQAVPLIALVDSMQAVGWPALALGLSLFAVGMPHLAPRWVVVIGVVGAVSIGLAGLLVQGLHLVKLGPLFLVGNLLAVWMIWAGIQAARRGASGIYETLEPAREGAPKSIPESHP